MSCRLVCEYPLESMAEYGDTISSISLSVVDQAFQLEEDHFEGQIILVWAPISLEDGLRLKQALHQSQMPRLTVRLENPEEES